MPDRSLLRSLLKASALAGAFAAAAAAQIPAPGALDNYSGCRHNTCTWVPLNNAQHTFRRGAYTYTVTPGDGTFILDKGAKTLLSTKLDALSASVSVVWNHDNDAFAVTWSDGGAAGGFHTRVFSIHKGELDELSSVATAQQNFATEHLCTVPTNNVQAYTWPRQEQLVLVASVYPADNCGEAAGTTEAYTVNANTGAILDHMTQDQFVQFAHQHPE